MSYGQRLPYGKKLDEMKLFQLMRSHGYTFADLHLYSGVHQYTLRKILKGQLKPTRRTVSKIAGVFGLQAEELLAVS